MQSNEICGACTFFSSVIYVLDVFDRSYSFYLQLAALQLIEKGKLQMNTPVSNYLPTFKNPIILDDITANQPSLKPATKVVRVEHLLNFSSGLFYGSILNIPTPYVIPHDEEDPVAHFYSAIKVSLLSRFIKSFVCLYSAG